MICVASQCLNTMFLAHFQGVTVPYVTTPGYTISRGKAKVAMVIKTEDFFDPEPEDKT